MPTEEQSSTSSDRHFARLLPLEGQKILASSRLTQPKTRPLLCLYARADPHATEESGLSDGLSPSRCAEVES